ncbi:MAG: LacI family DNA-binding transcriptional regulator [Pseudomonadota bacterium]
MTSGGSTDTVTADDVAALAGVSRWTVNRAFKKNAPVSEKSRKKIMQAAEQLGYAPDLLASSLASNRSNLVALLVDDFANPHKPMMLERLTRALRANGWDTILVNTLDENDASVALLHASQRRVDAAVLIGSRFNDRGLATALGARRVRKLIVFARFSVNPDTISVCCDDEAAMAEIIDHVMRKGYRRPVFLAGPQTISAHLLRKETFLTRWRELTGIAPKCLFVGIYDPQPAYQRVSEYLAGIDAADRPDILVCENDALAMGAADAIRYEFSLRIPEDIAVTGFDDVPQSSNPNYRLTTYRQPLTAMAEGLVRVLKGETDATALSRFAGQLVVREST